MSSSPSGRPDYTWTPNGEERVELLLSVLGSGGGALLRAVAAVLARLLGPVLRGVLLLGGRGDFLHRGVAVLHAFLLRGVGAAQLAHRGLELGRADPAVAVGVDFLDAEG